MHPVVIHCGHPSGWNPIGVYFPAFIPSRRAQPHLPRTFPPHLQHPLPILPHRSSNLHLQNLRTHTKQQQPQLPPRTATRDKPPSWVASRCTHRYPHRPNLSFRPRRSQGVPHLPWDRQFFATLHPPSHWLAQASAAHKSRSTRRRHD